MQSPYPVSVLVSGSDGSTGMPDVKVTLINSTKNERRYSTTSSGGQVIFDLANFEKGYSNADSLKVDARIGSFKNTTTATVNTSTGFNDVTLTLAAFSQHYPILLDWAVFKEELVTFLRRNLDDPANRLSKKTDVFSCSESTLKFTLSETTAKTITKVMMNNTVLNEYTQWFANYQDKNTMNYPAVYLLTPATSGDIVEIEYRYGSSDWVYPDLPRVDLTVDSYPRVMIDMVSGRTEEFGLGGTDNISDVMVQVTTWSDSMSELLDLQSKIRELIMQNKKNFFFIKLLVPSGESPVIKSADRAEKIMQMSQDFLMRFQVETTE